MVTIWGLRGDQKSQAKDRDTETLDRPRVEEGHWAEKDGGEFRALRWGVLSNLVRFQLFLGMLCSTWIQYESNMNLITCNSVNLFKAGLERRLSWSAERMNWKIAWPGSFLIFLISKSYKIDRCPSQKSEVLLCCYAFLLIKSLFFGV